MGASSESVRDVARSCLSMQIIRAQMSCRLSSNNNKVIKDWGGRSESAGANRVPLQGVA